MKVCLDIGHGMSNRKKGVFDPGAVGSFSREYDINKKTALLVKEYLEASQVEVVLIDGGPLETRDDIANRAQVTCGISFHCNAVLIAKNKAYGTEIYYYSEKGKVLANSVYRYLKPVVRKWRGLKEEKFFILRKTKAPWILIELGFITHPEEEKWLNTPSVEEALAKAVAQGICEYLGVNFLLPRKKKTPSQVIYRLKRENGTQIAAYTNWNYLVEALKKLVDKEGKGIVERR